jgi:RNA polymerase sigma factor (sigma-70 family)
MNEQKILAERFEGNRSHLQGIAYRMLGSRSEADDAVQEAWLRLARSDTSAVANLSGWLTTVVARVCLDMLRGRKARREDELGPHVPEPAVNPGADAEREALLADSVGLALLVVLETLTPAERVAFVLHDMFDLSFDEIAPIVGRSSAASRQLASRARRRVQGAPAVDDADVGRQREVVEAFLAASRGGDFDALLAVLDPDVVVRPDRAALAAGAADVHGAPAVARQAIAKGARFAQAALIDGTVGIVVAPHGRLLLVLRPRIARGRIVEVEVIGDPERLRKLDLAVLNRNSE